MLAPVADQIYQQAKDHQSPGGVQGALAIIARHHRQIEAHSMACTLTDALHDLDLPTIVRSNKDMERIRVALEANTQPEEALKIVDSLTRFVVERTGAQLTQEFAQALRDLTDFRNRLSLQVRVKC